MKKKILRECLEIAKSNNNSNHPQWECYHHFSFIVQRNKIVGMGTNRMASSLTFLGYQPYSKMHSETDVYFKVKGIMAKNCDFEVVNIRLTKTFMIKSSEPCKCCFAFLNNMGCKRIWFTTNTGNFAHISF